MGGSKNPDDYWVSEQDLCRRKKVIGLVHRTEPENTDHDRDVWRSSLFRRRTLTDTTERDGGEPRPRLGCLAVVSVPREDTKPQSPRTLGVTGK